ncbi:phenyloxazoline synthase mbtB [Mycobacteroides abscessus subsp. abscessus]|nr:phenyloxazoline synthase mbtB [Mycobacteroides abscessus subsp. abscessus]
MYLEHVLGLCSSFLGSDVRVIDVGAGSGLLATRLAKLVRRYTAIDPSPVALDRLLARLGGAETDTTVGFAHELSSDVFADADLVLFSSCVQFFPSLSYLWRVLETVSAGLTSGSHVVLADLVDADSSMPARGHLGVTRAFCRSLSRLGYSVEIRERGDGWPEALSHRFDVLLTFTRQTGAHGREVLDLDAAGEVAALPRALSAHDPAYCIFTSGSTGDPKGVLVSHRAAANIIAWVNGEIGVGPGDRMLSVAPLAFDLSIYDLFGVPAAGATVVFAPQRLLADPDELVDLIEQHSVTLWNSAPAAFAFLLTAATPDGAQRRASVRHVLLSGDFVPLTMPGQLRACFPEAKLTVLGGATEATVWSSFHHTNGIDPAWVSIPYGTPVANSSYYVLDEHKHLAPIGSPGELHIGGDGVALGYVGDPDTTKRKFVPDPWRGAGSRMYATGDLVRVTSDGTSEILGRIDSQVKVNGHRIELTEIESALTRHDAVLTAGAWVDSAGKLCAAITERPGGAVDVSLVRAFIGSILPTYMVPSSLTRVDSLPMSYNGKLDRARLDTWVSAHAAN